MLSSPAPFPFPGAAALLAETGEHARILQVRSDGRYLVSLTGRCAEHPDIATRASGNRTVFLSEIRDPAVEVATARKPRRKARRK